MALFVSRGSDHWLCNVLGVDGLCLPSSSINYLVLIDAFILFIDTVQL